MGKGRGRREGGGKGEGEKGGREGEEEEKGLTWLCEREVDRPSKTITLNRTKETRKTETTVVRVDGMEVGREEGRRRESFVK